MNENGRMAIILYGAAIGAIVFPLLHWLIKNAIADGVKSALTSSEVHDALSTAVSHAVSRSLDLERQGKEFAEEND